MLPENYFVFFQILILVFEVVIMGFTLYYFLNLRGREKKLETSEIKEDTSYHQIVNDALSRERKILEDATLEADQIVTGAQYVQQSSKEAINQALAELVKEIQKESVDTATKFMSDYATNLQKLSQTSLSDFQQTSENLQTDLKQQIKSFRESMLPDLQKELDAYKQMRLKETEELVKKIVEQASQNIFNRSLSLDDHQKLLTDSLEKAKAEGVFD
jgi:hypothetical protein